MPVQQPGADVLDFAAGLRGSEAVPLALVNDRTDRVIAEVVELAVTRRARRQGLLGRDGLPASTGMVLAPCFGIHTAFMRFPIDAAFVSRSGTVVKMVHEMTAWRMAIAPRAYAVVELPAGTLRGSGVATGDRLHFVRRPVDSTSAAPAAGGRP